MKKFSSTSYWEDRYANNGSSGDGSYGKLAQYKADFINRCISNYEIENIVELGCGDGNQLGLLEVKKYLGMDVSPSVINRCRKSYENDDAKSFMFYQPNCFENKGALRFDMSLSLDVIYHLVERDVYKKYLLDLFSLSPLVLIYSTDFNKNEEAHVCHRRFSEDVRHMFPAYELIDEESNPFTGTGFQESNAVMKLYKRRS